MLFAFIQRANIHIYHLNCVSHLIFEIIYSTNKTKTNYSLPIWTKLLFRSEWLEIIFLHNPYVLCTSTLVHISRAIYCKCSTYILYVACFILFRFNYGVWSKTLPFSIFIKMTDSLMITRNYKLSERKKWKTSYLNYTAVRPILKQSITFICKHYRIETMT